jgi:hypothetical protein
MYAIILSQLQRMLVENTIIMVVMVWHVFVGRRKSPIFG